MSLLNKRIVDPVLTSLARGFSQPNLVASQLFPEVFVEKEGGKVPLFNKEAFKIYNTERAIRANSNVINPEGINTLPYSLTEHDIAYPMDYREVAEDIRNLKVYATHVTTETIKLRLEKQVADLVQNLASFPVGNKVTLAAGDKFDNDASNPVHIFESAKEAVRAKIAKRPNVAIIGASAYSALKNHPKILEKIRYTQHAIMTPALLASLLEIPNLFIGEAVYSSDDDVFADVWSDNVVLAYIPGQATNVERSLYEPSFGYTFKKRNFPIVDVYAGEGNKVEFVRNTDIFQALIVGADAGFLINDTNS